ncbi:hypothetical protein Q5H92_13215 [Hymenobacter sp. M29]|uniref:Lipoprotein n=1 Tax=Hymenobacter mellowenesis TaxID=3063995 RepID=A0ABT9AEA0_9BACT|nr:hypothetical protein [Hymenobacter sp. M29]MDO7847326.1 hypothetical protein [Hymenobacter sp. M29]
MAALAGCQPERPKEHPGDAEPLPPAPPAAAQAGPAAPAAAKASAETVQLPAPAHPADTEPVEPVWRVVNSPARRVLQVHRYVGTIGGQPATAELQWYHPDSIMGSFYLHQTGPAYRLEGIRQKPGPIVLTVDAADYDVIGQWHLQSRPGTAVLNARWRDGHRQRTVALRESYVGAVRYGVRTSFYSADSAGSILQDFLTLPFPTSVHPRLRPLLNPGPQARIQLMNEAREDLCDATNRLSVLLNDFGLFSYRLAFESRQTDGHGGRKDDQTSFLFDLVSGRPLAVESQLRPSYELPLRRLLAKQLPADAKENLCLAYITHDDPTLAELPDIDMCLTATGLEATYGAAQVCGPQTLHVSYRELRPLVRPGTPLARMLAARGL